MIDAVRAAASMTCARFGGRQHAAETSRRVEIRPRSQRIPGFAPAASQLGALRAREFRRGGIIPRVRQNRHTARRGHVDARREHVNHDGDVSRRERRDGSRSPFTSTGPRLLTECGHVTLKI
jgi:hypothetical protein